MTPREIHKEAVRTANLHFDAWVAAGRPSAGAEYIALVSANRAANEAQRTYQADLAGRQHTSGKLDRAARE